MTSLDRFLPHTCIAYLSMEIALEPGIPTYSGGLGVLAGDTVRSCADLELPMVFVTLISRQGYLRQSIAPDGSQQESADPWNPADHAEPLDAAVAVRIDGRPVWILPWLYRHECPHGGCAPVILLDTNLEVNDPADRSITDRLYGDGEDLRLKQEIVLGIGGERILRALGFEITTWHLNEGHAALLPLSLLRRHPLGRDEPLSTALRYDAEPVRERCVFTTHTPVEAGHDRFSYDLVHRMMGDFFEIGQLRQLAGAEELNMTRLALNLSGWVNGVAARHAETAQRMFPGYHIHAVTNGVHVPTWTHPAFAALFQQVAPEWAHDPGTLRGADHLPDEAVWTAHMQAKGELLEEVRQRCGTALDPALPLIVFARRMTGYKRADLLFSDLAQLRRIAREFPFQVLMAGKAHPRDEGGKTLIREVHAHARELAGTLPVVFVPNYEMGLAKKMVAGADIWLNTPLPPMEASGTSGMKAALNGVPHLSVLDGWWAEACEEGANGWAIGSDGGAPSQHAGELYDKLWSTVLPLWHHDRAGWIALMKQVISRSGSRFNSQRMMRRYATEAYLR
ncbi:alpha-glucan family phosphorylase [Roseomonas sp. E05]|uniref:alpha-glucan family phosphorylase n=1 Tax=Roseomonas sp. E05 TaxID=3046310 RepID=UPI0024BB3E24|nr:alpha-glucan family phosphorylase [Roseomonas sp. E05]MDJ0386910.1 alpha-glucan family phosphorylase [Roseomonas sp. E05]